jgi:SAM-dependent methyltransferase
MNPIRYASHNWLVHAINNAVVARHLPTLRGRVLDLGCGTMPYRDDILGVADEYIGVDWPSSLHDGAADVRADVSEGVPLAGDCADAVVAFQVMEHLREPQRFLEECHRVVRPGGMLLLTLPFMWHVHEAPHDYFRFTRHGLAYLLGKAGFVDVRIEETTGFWQCWVLKLNYHTARFARGPLRPLFVPLWWLGQLLAPMLDRIDRHPEESAGYVARARKPGGAVAVA